MTEARDVKARHLSAFVLRISLESLKLEAKASATKCEASLRRLNIGHEGGLGSGLLRL